MVDYTSGLDDSVVKEKNRERVTSVEKFDGRDWSRDNIRQRLKEVQSTKDTIETILQDIDEQLDRIPSEEELKDKWRKFIDRQPTDEEGNAKALPRAFFEAERERFELMKRYAVWEARLQELESFARRKVGEKFESLLEEHRTARSYETIESAMEDMSEQFVVEVVEDKVQELDAKIGQVEKLGQALREERRSLWNMMERVAEQESSSLSKGEVKEAEVEALEEFVKENGVFELDERVLEQDRKESERRSAAESAAESAVEESNDVDVSDEGSGSYKNSDGVYELKDKDFEDKVDVLVELWDEESIHERIDDPDDDITKSEVADMVDVSQAALFNNGLFERIREEEELFLRTP